MQRFIEWQLYKEDITDLVKSSKEILLKVALIRCNNFGLLHQPLYTLWYGRITLSRGRTIQRRLCSAQMDC